MTYMCKDKVFIRTFCLWQGFAGLGGVCLLPLTSVEATRPYGVIDRNVEIKF